MLALPKKGFFEGRDAYFNRLTKGFEKVGLDSLNAHYAADFYIRSKMLKMGDYRKGDGPELIVRAIKMMIKNSDDVTVPGNIKDSIDALQKQSKTK